MRELLLCFYFLRKNLDSIDKWTILKKPVFVQRISVLWSEVSMDENFFKYIWFKISTMDDLKNKQPFVWKNVLSTKFIHNFDDQIHFECVAFNICILIGKNMWGIRLGHPESDLKYPAWYNCSTLTCAKCTNELNRVLEWMLLFILGYMNVCWKETV